jgi:hypothetical protein
MRKAKMPKPPKLQRPKVKVLRAILKGLMTVSIQNRLATLAYALQWYDAAILYLIQRQKLSADAQKRIVTAVKCRKQAVGTDKLEEQESGFLMALRFYEKACVALRPPEVDKFFKLYQVRKDGLEKRQKRMEQKYGFVISLLQKAIENRVVLQVADAVKGRQYDPALSSLSYNRETARQLATQFRVEGFLSVFIGELDFLAQHVALERNNQGGYDYDPARQVKVTEELLASFLKFAKTAEAPKKLVRSGVVPIQTPKQPKVPGQAPSQGAQRGFSRGPKVGGILVPGTAVALLYDRLKDGKVHPLAETLAGIQSPNPLERIKNLHRSGAKKGMWTVSITGTDVQLIHSQPPVNP